METVHFQNYVYDFDKCASQKRLNAATTYLLLIVDCNPSLQPFLIQVILPLLLLGSILLHITLHCILLNAFFCELAFRFQLSRRTCENAKKERPDVFPCSGPLAFFLTTAGQVADIIQVYSK